MAAARRSVAKKEVVKESTPKTSRTNLKPASFKVPSFKSIKANYTPILVVLLIVASFLIGVLITKVSYLEKGVGTGTQAAAGTAPAAGAPAAPAPGTKVDVGTGHFPALGKDDAKVTIVEFADFRCPFCEKLFTDVSPQLKTDYIDTGKVKFYFRQYAFLGPASTVAANAAECANEQDKFWDFHDYLYKNQPPESDTTMYTTENMTKIAGDLGMDTGKFQSCLSSNKYQDKVTSDLNDGSKAGVTGTPATFVNGVLISGAVPYAQFKSAIDAELAK